MIPPMELPDAARPMARPILVVKYVGIIAIEGMYKQPAPIPIVNP
jgi:hypothetical protein